MILNSWRVQWRNIPCLHAIFVWNSAPDAWTRTLRNSLKKDLRPPMARCQHWARTLLVQDVPLQAFSRSILACEDSAFANLRTPDAWNSPGVVQAGLRHTLTAGIREQKDSLADRARVVLDGYPVGLAVALKTLKTTCDWWEWFA